MTHKDYIKININGIDMLRVFEYSDDATVKSYVIDLPESKHFDTGYVHLQFDISTQEYKDFCADPRTSEFLNNQKVEMSYLGIQFRKNLIDVLTADTVLSEGTSDKLHALLDTWATQLKNPNS